MSEISDIMRRVVTLFEARGADQVRTMLGTMRSGFGGLRRDLDQVNRSSGYVNNQLRALGTTLRYAFAGQAIFGTLMMVRNLGQFQAKLGEIQAIATGPNGLPLINRQIDELGNRLLHVSNETTQPIEDLQAGVISLYSTIGNVPQNEAASMMETIGNVAITAQSNIEDTTQALLGMLNAFSRGTQELPKFGDEFFKVIQLSAGMPGRIYAQQLGRLQSSAALSRFGPEEMGALAVGATRFGGSPATNMRGLAQLMTFVMNPSGAKAEAAFSSIGLGRAQRNKMGGMAVLRRVLAEANARGLSGNPRGLTDDMVAQLDEQFQGNAPNSALGIRGGGAQLLSQLFPRIEGRRIAAVLARLQTPSQVAGTTNKTLDQYLNEIANSAGSVDRAMGRAMDYRRIVQAGNAMHNFGIEIGTALSPLIGPGAKAFTGGVDAFGQQRWGLGPVTGQQLEIGGGILGTAALLRMLRNGGRSTNLLRGAGALGAGVDLLTEQGRGNTPANPLYVAVVYSLSGPGSVFGGRGSVGIPERDMRAGGIGAGVGAGAASAGRMARAGRAARFAGGRVLPLMLFPTMLETMDMLFPASAEQNRRHAVESQNLGSPLLKSLARVREMAANSMGAFTDTSRLPNAAERKILDMVNQGKLSPEAAERRLRSIATPKQLLEAGLKVQGRAEITIHDERTKKSVTVPVDMFPNFTTPAPQQKGKNTTRRGN